MQSNPGVGVTLKHYDANNQETQRSGGNSVMSERTAREIYLKGFEIAVKAAQPMAIMTSYNRVNGTYSSANYDMNTDLLRGEWGFKGLVMTDWGGSHGAVATMYSGNDLIMPGSNPAEVINATKKVPPTIDVAGLPVYVTHDRPTRVTSLVVLVEPRRGSPPRGRDRDVQHDCRLVHRPVRPPSPGDHDRRHGQGFVPVSYGSVDDAYNAVTGLLDPANTALSASQKAGHRRHRRHTTRHRRRRPSRSPPTR